MKRYWLSVFICLCLALALLPTAALADGVNPETCGHGNEQVVPIEGNTEEHAVNCVLCGKRLRTVVHEYEEKVTKDPTCTEDGVRTYTCTSAGCGMTKTEAIPAAHAFDAGTETTPASCTQAGVKTFTCTREDCNETKTEDLPILAHEYENGECKNCGAKEPEEPCEHNNKLLYVDLKNGTHSVACGDCTEKFDPEEHTGEWEIKKPATETEDGSKTRECSKCGAKETKVIPATGKPENPPHTHTFTVKGTPVPATCTTDGYTPYTCACGEGGFEKQVIVKALGHTVSKWTVTTPATATTSGLRTGTCERCGQTQTETIPATGTTPSTSTTPGTLTLARSPGGLGQKVTAKVTSGHWLTIQVSRNSSIAISSVQSTDGTVTFSAASGSIIKAWETEKELAFDSKGAPSGVILAVGQTVL